MPSGAKFGGEEPREKESITRARERGGGKKERTNPYAEGQRQQGSEINEAGLCFKSAPISRLEEGEQIMAGWERSGRRVKDTDGDMVDPVEGMNVLESQAEEASRSPEQY